MDNDWARSLPSTYQMAYGLVGQAPDSAEYRYVARDVVNYRIRPHQLSSN